MKATMIMLDDMIRTIIKYFVEVMNTLIVIIMLSDTLSEVTMKLGEE